MKSQIEELTNLTGKTALITGAAGHIGSMMSHTLANLGANLYILDRDDAMLLQLKEILENEHNVNVQAICLDLENIDALGVVSEIVNKRLDILVNNAAFVGTSSIEGWSTDFENQSISTWERALKVNLTSAFALSKICKSFLDKSGCATIINIGSIYGFLGPDRSLYEGTNMDSPGAYAASKGGLLQLTRWMSTVLAPGIRVNSISPGGIERGQPTEFASRYISRTPLRRMGTEEDLKGALIFLATDMSKWVTGQNIIVDGGWSAW